MVGKEKVSHKGNDRMDIREFLSTHYLEERLKCGINMKNIYCTLFDSGYLDKGLVMYHSLQTATNDFKLYVLAMDDICFRVLEKYDLPNLTLISLNEFEDDELKVAKRNRSKAEYCWTCSSGLIYYIFKRYHEEICTYIDADLYFYQDPQILVDEIVNNKASIGLIEHRFPKNIEGKYSQQNSGTYCVQFNTFRNDVSGMEALEYWRRCSLEDCRKTSDGKHFGDQMYLEDWLERFEKVHVIQNEGAGLARWNISDYKNYNPVDNTIFYKREKERVGMVFYHFHGIEMLSDQEAKINVFPTIGWHDKKSVNEIYGDYLYRIYKMRQKLRLDFGLDWKINKTQNINGSKRNYYRLRLLFSKNGLLYFIKFLTNRIYGKMDIVSIDEG